MFSTLTTPVLSDAARPLRWLIPIALIGALAACGGEGAGDDINVDVDGGTGGSGDDADASRALLEPFIGTYNITGSWNGEPGDEALMVIRAPDSSGVSDVVIYDFSPDLGNCYQVLRPGEASKEPVGNRVFLDKIIQFDDAVLSLSGTTLVIDYFDSFDGDGDGNTTEQIIYPAPRVDQMEQDIGVLC